MGVNPGLRNGRRHIAFMAVIIMIVLLSALVSGCKPDTPEAAAKAFYNSVQEANWNAYIDSILPENVRRMTPEERTYQEQSIKEAGITFKGLKFESKYTNKEKSKATVSLVAGEMAQKDPSTGEKQVITIKEVIEQSGKPPELNAVKYKGRWYIDVPLSQKDIQTESQPQVEQEPSGSQQTPNQQ